MHGRQMILEVKVYCVCQSKRLANVHQESQHLVDTRVSLNGVIYPRGGRCARADTLVHKCCMHNAF